MKKIIILFFSLLFISNISTGLTVKAETRADEEMRGVWITTVYNQDWPSSSSKNNVQAQQEEFIRILEDIKSLGLNSVFVQIRPKGDALYKSNINPWSDVLTGVQGKDPGYDPLAFIINEAHKRDIEVHGWLNPYRVTTSGTDWNVLAENHFARQNPHTLLGYNNALVYNPGLPEVRQHIVDTVAEIVKNYNIDGIHFDDYFYPGANVDDSLAFQMYGNGQDIGSFRRDSVNKMVKSVYETVKTINSNVKFGISPRGIWKNQSSDPTGSPTSGAQSYYDIYADTRAWIQNGWIDYVAPQVYWEIGNKAADYSKLIPWWANEVANTNVDLYIGQGIYKPEVAAQTEAQVNLNRQYNAKGSVFFSYRDIKNDVEGVRGQLINLYKGDNTTPPTENSGVFYKTHVQNEGWQAWKSNGELSGTEGERKRLEGIRITVNNLVPGASISYRTHIQNIGWQAWKSNGEFSGTEGQSKRLEGIQIKLENAPGYSVIYRVHVEDLGWQNWRRDGEMAGTEGQSKRLEAIEIKVVENKKLDVAYQTHIQNVGWENYKYNGQQAGTTGSSRRLEGIKINVNNMPDGGRIRYKTHVQDYGWQDWSYDGAMSGTEGKAKRLEGIQIELENLPGYSVEYRVHIQDIGWQEWKIDGEMAGTTGKSKRLEAIEINIIEK